MNVILQDELIIDNFAGGGGASLGLELACGRVDIAINHDPVAVAMHTVNHPNTYHYTQNINAVDPVEVVKGRPVGLAWFSPDCTHHSKAAGRRPRSKRIRDLAWVVVHWAQRVRPRIICLENVEEFREWGPLTAEGQPCPKRKGETFEQWLGELRKLGYVVEFRELRACDYGAPTIRKRLFLIARCDGRPIVWPEPTHGPGRIPYRVAAECIDWALPVRSIFGRTKPLAEATQRRIARGIKRYVLETDKPFIIKFNQNSIGQPLDQPLDTVMAGAPRFGLVSPHMLVNTSGHSGGPADAPLHTVTTGGHHGVVSPLFVGVGGRAGQSRPRPADEPAATTTSKADTALITPFFVPRHGERQGQDPRCSAVEVPMPTVTPGSEQGSLVAPFFVPHHGEAEGQAPRCASPLAPMATVTPCRAHATLVAAWMIQHNLGATGHAMAEPVSTILSTGSHQQLVTSNLTVLRNHADGRSLEEPLPVICAEGTHLAEVRAFLQTYYGTDQDTQLEQPLPTVTTKDRFGLVVTYQLIDIGMRMLSPRELFRAQGFPDTYKIDPDYQGRPLTKTAQVRCCGNSVCPPLAAAIARANYNPNEAITPNVWSEIRRRREKQAVGQGGLF